MLFSAIKKQVLKFNSDSLFRNSVYLILATVSMSGFGFIFWLVCARMFSANNVGLSTTLISITTIIASLSQLGLGNGIIKYLPSSESKHKIINSSLTLIALTSLFFSIIFLVFVSRISPNLAFLKNNYIYSLSFLFLTTFISLNIAADNIFIAYRTAIFVFLKSTLFSIVKLLLPFVFVFWGAYGIFTSYGVGSVIAFLMSIVFLYKYQEFKPRFKIDVEVVRKMTRFSLSSHLAGFVGNLPTLILPMIITGSIGPKFSAYYYMDLMIANLLYVIPTAASQSLFAEGSHDSTDIKNLTFKAFKQTFFVVTPIIVLTIFLGKYLLLVFGKQYSDNGYQLLQIMSVNGIFVSVNLITESILKVRHQMKAYIIINFVYASCIIILSHFLSFSYGLIGVGIGLTVGSLLTTTLSLIATRKIFIGSNTQIN